MPTNHSIRKRTIAAAMSLLMLLASATPALSRMSCLSSGNDVYSMSDLQTCCLSTAPTEHATITAQCCVFGKAKASLTSMAVHDLPAVPVLTVLTVVNWHPVDIRGLQTFNAWMLQVRPPPLSVPELLSLICVLRA